MMKKPSRLLPLPRMILGGLAAAALLASAAPVRAEATVEYARITVGSGYSQKGRYTVSDSLTRNVGVAVQKSARFTVTSVKGLSQTTGLKNWKHYK